MAAGFLSPVAVRQSLVRLGHLGLDDFLLLDPNMLASSLILQPASVADWSLATNNAPHILLHFRRAATALPAGFCAPASDFVPTREQVLAAQERLVAHFAYDLLRAKAPPLYDALPWQDWDFSIVEKRYKLWQTRFLLAGDGTTVTMCRCRKSAGVYVVEPNETTAGYIGRKAEVEKVRRFRLLSLKLSEIPLPDNSVDLAIIGSVPSLETGHWRLVLQELLRVSTSVLLVENNPLCLPLDEKPLTDAGFRPDSVAVSGLGQRRCWWRTSRVHSPA